MKKILTIIGLSLLLGGCTHLDANLLGIWSIQDDFTPTYMGVYPNTLFDIDYLQDGTKEILGRYELHNNTITFYLKNNHIDCDFPGTYTYSINNDILTFELIKDGCETREEKLSKPWKREKNLFE